MKSLQFVGKLCSQLQLLPSRSLSLFSHYFSLLMHHLVPFRFLVFALVPFFPFLLLDVLRGVFPDPFCCATLSEPALERFALTLVAIWTALKF